jgi:hypothetical protein
MAVAAPDEDSLAPPIEGGGVLPDAPAPVETGRRARRRRRNRRKHLIWVTAFGTILAVLVAAVPTLAFVGFRAVYRSRAGKIVHPNLDPTAPGYEAQVEHTPVELLVQVDGTNTLRSLTLLSLSGGDNGGAVLFIPIDTTATFYGSATDTLAHLYANDGVDAMTGAIAAMLNVGIDEPVVVGPDRWTQLVGPVAPLRFTNPDDIRAGTGPAAVDFPAGPISLTAAEVPVYLEASSPGESDLARLVRQEDLWTAWLKAVQASSDPAKVPGEVTSGIGRFVRGLAIGVSDLETLPVQPTPGADGSSETFEPQTEAIQALLVDLVQFPTSPILGGRTRVRLLDGAHVGTARDTAIRELVGAGAEIDTIGNASSFDNPTTIITYYDPTAKAAAETLRTALGVGRIVLEKSDSDTIQVTVQLGRDYVTK